MTISVSTPLTGESQSGLTSPTYTNASDTNPDNNAKQWIVTALGGTQTGVIPHSISSPFTIAFWRPKAFKMVAWVGNIVGSQVRSVPKNVYKVITRKGVLIAADQAPQTLIITTEISVPAGSDSYDPLSVKAALSAHFGVVSQQSSNLGDLVTTGSL
jgi:hypothetical protein